MAIKMPKLERKTLLMAVGGVIIAAGAGWYVWDNFLSAPPPPPPPPPVKAAAKPAAPKPAAPAPSPVEKSIVEMMAATGLNEHLKQMVDSSLFGFLEQQEALKGQIDDAILKRNEAYYRQAMTMERIRAQAMAQFTKYHDEAKLRALLEEVKQPAVSKIIEMEKVPLVMADFRAYVGTLRASPPSDARVRLLIQVDALRRFAETNVVVTQNSLRGALAMGEGSAEKGAKLPDEQEKVFAEARAKMEKQLANVEKEQRTVALQQLLYQYRNASDAELAEYVKLRSTEASDWYHANVMAVVVESQRTSAANFIARVRAPAGKPPAEAAPVAVEPVPAPPRPAAGTAATPGAAAKASADAPRRRSRANEDARICLDQPTPAKIARCAEQYR